MVMTPEEKILMDVLWWISAGMFVVGIGGLIGVMLGWW